MAPPFARLEITRIAIQEDVVTDVVQGIIAGGVLGAFTAILIVNAQDSWQTFVDGASHGLNGQREYTLHFPPGGLSSNDDAFWSMTMAIPRRFMVGNPIYRGGGRSGLVPSAGGSIDIYIQNTPSAVHESNWPPAPPGNFVLWLRVSQPGGGHPERHIPGAACRRSEGRPLVKHQHLFILGTAAVVAWVLAKLHFSLFRAACVLNETKTTVVKTAWLSRQAGFQVVMAEMDSSNYCFFNAVQVIFR